MPRVKPKIAVSFLPVLFLLSLALPLRAQTSFDFDDCAGKADPDLAIAACTRAIDAQSDAQTLGARDLAAAYLLRAVAWQAKHELDRSIVDCDRAIELSPRYALAFHSRGVAWRGKGDYDRAIADFDEAVHIKKDFGRAYFDRGVAYADRGDADRALKDYNEALRIEKFFPPALEARGVLYLERSAYDRAIRDFDLATKLTSSANPFFDRGLARFALGQFDAAAADFTSAAQYDSRNAGLGLWLYLVRARSGRDAQPLLAAVPHPDPSSGSALVLNLFRGATSPEGFLSAAANSALNGAGGNAVCQAHFYVGEFRLLHGDSSGARADLQATAADCPAALPESIAAKSELARLPK